jgi:hypothetical protein
VDIQLLDQEVQAVDFAPLLKACDFLFVDSSHVYKFGSDVEFEFSRIYPQLQSGTIMHLHDIYLPWHYPMDWMVNQKRFWNEQYILESFLMFNSEFQILLPMTYLMRQSDSVPAEMHSLSLDKDFLFESSSFYLRRR